MGCRPATLELGLNTPLPGATQWGGAEGTTQLMSNAAMNHLLPCDAPAHGWYRFVLSFPPHLVREYVSRLKLDATATVLDPFCGTGTTLVEAKKLGIPSVGVEALPIAHLATRTKVDWSPDPDRLVAHAELVAEKALTTLEADGITDAPMAEIPSEVCLRSLPQEQFRLLLKNSISPLPLHKTLVLLEAMESELKSTINSIHIRIRAM